ncbi:unnamed protein product, partial [Rotaria sp. Silwood1]
MSSMNELVPASTRVSYIQPQYLSDDRQMQQYQPVKQQPSKSDSFQSSSLVSVTNDTEKKCSIMMLASGILIGLVVCGVPLAIMATLYAQTESTNTTSGTSNTASSTTLPSQCSSYTTISDATRNVGYSSSFSSCDSSLTAGWYRFVSPAGTQLATSAVNSGYCGANYGTWFNGSLPTTVGGMSGGFACSYYSGS